MKLGYQSTSITEMQFYELLDFPVPWWRSYSSSSHDLVQSQGGIRMVVMVIPAVLSVVLAQIHEISLIFCSPSFPAKLEMPSDLCTRL